MNITHADIAEASVWTASQTGMSVGSISVIYRKDLGGDVDWTVSVSAPLRRGRGSRMSIEGYGEVPAAAAKQCIETYKRAVADGVIK